MTEDVLSLTELRAHLTEKVDALSRGSGQLIVTRNGRVAAVLLSPEAYDSMAYESFVRSKLAAGLEDVARGRLRAHGEVMEAARAHLEGLRKMKVEE